VFALDQSIPGNFAAGAAPDGGTDAVHVSADALCQSAAEDAGRGGTFRAWISSSGTSALEYLTSLGMNGPWYRPDGFLVAENRTALVTSAGSTGIAAHIVLKADGSFAAPGPPPLTIVWTGTAPDGSAGVNCNDFTTASTTVDSRAGQTVAKHLVWSAVDIVSCDTLQALFCFEE
jgi:hypothetical protein